MATVDELRSDIGAAVILLLTVQAVDPSSGAVSTWRFATSQDLPPDTPYNFLPYLEISSPYVASLASGPALSGPSRLDYGAFRIVNPGSGDSSDDYGDRPLDALATLELSGQPISVDVVGRLSDGEWVLYADREAWLPAGIVGETPAWDPVEGVTLPILEPGDKLTSRLYPPYRGLGKAVLFDGSTTSIEVDGAEWQAPGSFTVQAFVFYGEVPSGGLRGIFSKGDAFALPIDLALSNAAPAQLLAFVDTGADSDTAASTPSDISQRMVWAQMTYDATTGVISTWIDEDPAATVTLSGGAAADVSTETIYLGGEPGNQPGYGPMAAWRLWDRVVPRAELIGYQSGVLPTGGGGSLVADWRGDYDITVATLYDYGPGRDELAGDSDLDGTIANGVAAHTLEGGTDLAGTDRPVLLGHFGNIPAIPIAPEFGLYQLCAHPSPVPDAFMDKRSPYTLDRVTSVIGNLFLGASNPAAGEYLYYWPLSIVRISNRSEGGQLTADGWGASLWRAGLYFDGTDDYGQLPNAVDSTLNGSAWTIDLVAHPRLVSGDNVHIFDRGGVASGKINIKMNVGPTGHNVVITLRIGGSVHTMSAPVSNIDDPVSISVSYATNSGDPSAELWVNGRFADDLTGDVLSSSGIDSFTGGATIHRRGSLYYEGSVSEIRIWNRALTADEVAEWYTTDPYGESGLLFHWRRPDQITTSAPTTWANSGSAGTANITLTGGPRWTGGVPCKGTVDGTRWILDRVGVDPDETNLESALATVADAAVAAYYGTPPPGESPPPSSGETRLPGQQIPVVASPAGDPTALLMIDRLRISQHCYLVYRRDTGLYTLVQLVDPSTIAESTAIDAFDLIEAPRPVEVLRPSPLYRVGWGPVAVEMTDDQFAGSVSDEDRAFYGQSLRYSIAAADAAAYPLSPPTYSVNGTFKHPVDSQSEANRIAALLGVRRVAYRCPLRYGLLHGFGSGLGRTLSHRRLPADLPSIIITSDDVATRGALILWG